MTDTDHTEIHVCSLLKTTKFLISVSVCRTLVYVDYRTIPSPKSRKIIGKDLKRAFGARPADDKHDMVKQVLSAIAAIWEKQPESKESERLILSPYFAQVNVENMEILSKTLICFF